MSKYNAGRRSVNGRLVTNMILRPNSEIDNKYLTSHFATIIEPNAAIICELLNDPALLKGIISYIS